ncbi:trifunctional dihydropteroate synthetase [Cladochytrium tenue]|nr:trifunctional dihydropteroate synthetase [Cladochytrium tenue]
MAAAALTSADRILIDGLQVRNVIGVDSWERSKKQPLCLSVSLATDGGVRASGRGDLLAESVHYGVLAKDVTAFAESSTYRSIEALAVGVARVCLARRGASVVTVSVEKPRGLLHASCAGVQVTRSRAEIEEIDRMAGSGQPEGGKPATADEEEDVLGDDQIYVRELVVSTIIGVNSWERIEKQRVVIDFTVFLRFSNGVIVGDLVPRMHNYRRMTRLVTSFVEASNYKTVEALVSNIAELLVTVCHAPKVKVKVRKPSALIFANSAGVEVVRDRAYYSIKPSVESLPDGEHIVALALGSNLGDRSKNIEFGIKKIAARCKLLDSSFLYETKPIFSDGGEHNTVETAVQWAKNMVSDGVDIIDIGGQSTRPHAEEISEEEEIRRVVPVIEAIRRAGIESPISIDTFRAAVARAAVDAGADLINDVTGGDRDPEMYRVMADCAVPVCLMHMRGDASSMDKLVNYEKGVVIEIQKTLGSLVERAKAAGVLRWNIIVDPGVGFAKTSDQSFEVIRNLGQLSGGSSPIGGLPVLVGPSRKRFLRDATGKDDPKDRVWATAAACTAAVASGASIVRVHDVKEMRDVVLVADKLFRAP